MCEFQHLELLSRGPVSRVRLLNQRPCYTEKSAELTTEWNSVADHVDCRALLLDCSNVEFLSSVMLSSLILLQRRLQQKKAKLVLAGLSAELREVLRWTKLDRYFEIIEERVPVTAASA